jgi:hypothetical protein
MGVVGGVVVGRLDRRQRRLGVEGWWLPAALQRGGWWLRDESASLSAARLVMVDGGICIGRVLLCLRIPSCSGAKAQH